MKAVEEAIRSDAPPTRVVVVEDDQASADVLQRRLQANGMVVSVAHDGQRGIALVEELLPDLVLLDVMLPDTDGYDVCLRIKSNSSTAPIPVIFLSARGEVVDKVRGLSCGAADYITKPFQAAELLARIDAVLGQARNPRVPRLVRTVDRSGGARLRARVAIGDSALAGHVERLLGSRFDIADGSEAPDVLIVEGNAPVPADAPEDASVIRVTGGRASDDRPEIVPVDAQLPRIVDLVVREERLDQDLSAAAEALIVLAAAVASHDRPSQGHSERVAARAVQIGRALGLDESTRMTIRLGALLKDVGNARLPAALLAKQGELTPDERAMLERHPILGEELLGGFNRLSGLLPIVRHHHERLDGTGYPDGLRAELIPLEVRIVTVADRFEALLTDRPDRPGVSEAEAVRILQGAVARGELDAAVVAALATQIRSNGGQQP
ncbi:MAG: response regulator [Chloroflexi bacterium]|nr:MAG: response regulator [Chloroflexota bacterium]TMG69487.1 MAG: response regulator [Chloroflexota bacterium]